MNYAYVRQLPDSPSLAQQHREIFAYALDEGFEIDKEVIEYSYKDLPLAQRQEFETFLRNIKSGDRLVVASLDTLSGRIEEVVKIINCILRHNATLCICDPRRALGKLSALVDVFPLLNGLERQREARRSKIGRPKGSKSHSKFDAYQMRIIESLREGKNVSAIARELEVSRSSLKDYIESRGLKELVENSWIGAKEGKAQTKERIVLICPFEQGSIQAGQKEQIQKRT